MKMPWTGKTGLAKAAAIFAVLTLVSFGLCGANFGIMFAFKGASANVQSALSGFLVITAFMEAAGIVIGIAGLLVIGLVAVVLGMVGPAPKNE
jgi:hypothetical protein